MKIKHLTQELKRHPFIYFLLTSILLVSIFLRIFKVNETLGFYFDQGRDALVIWNFWKHGDLFLVGPVTGIAGIFRGPWYYWLITPAYILGAGNPVYPAVFLSLLTVVAIFFLYLVASEIVNKEAGLVAAFIASSSYYILVHSRWLSNPTPMLLISIFLLWSMGRALAKKKWSWPLIGFLVGMAIQFGSAAEIFYIPIVIIFAIWQRKILPEQKILFFSFLTFFVAFIPQIVFDLLKGGVLSRALIDFLFDKSFKLSFWEIIEIRLEQYYNLFTSIIYLGDKNHLLAYIFLGIAIVGANFKFFLGNPMFKLLLLFIIFPLVGMLFFQGNHGNVFDYYFSGYYFPVILLFALPLGFAAKNWGGKIAIVVFVMLFIRTNLQPVSDFLRLGRTHFTFLDQKKAIEWVYSDAHGKDFNVDVYVPPVIPYAYDYLFKWYGSMDGKREPSDQKTNLLYTLYELDPPNPDRLSNWLRRQETIGKVTAQISFHGITVQKRERIK